MGWLKQDPKQEKPDINETREAAKSLVINEEIIDDPTILTFIELLKKVDYNTKEIVKSYTVQSNNIIDWYAQRNGFNETDFFFYFFNNPNVLKTLPEEFSKNNIDSNTFKDYTNVYCLYNILADIIIFDGAYVRFKGNPQNIRELTDKVCYAMYEHRYEDILVYTYTGRGTWCSWFYNVVWDHSIIVIDKKMMKLWVILYTDTD